MKPLPTLLSLLVVGTLILAACAPSAAPSTPQIIRETVEVTTEPETVVQTVEVPAERTEIRLSGWASSPAETALLESLLYKCSIENPDIVVQYEPITGDYKAAMLTAFASGTEPDVFYVDIAYFEEFARSGVLLPLDDLMASSDVSREDFIPSLIEAFAYEGQVYGIPKDFNTLGLFYNKDLFAAASLEEPTDDWTWDDLKAAAEALSDPANDVYGFGVPADAGRFPVFVFQNGGSIMSEDRGDTLLDAAEAVEAAEFYTGFRADQSGAIPTDIGVDWQGTGFGQGQFAMVYEGGWLIPYLQQQFPTVQYGVVTPPAGPAGEGNLIFTVSWSIAASTQHPEEAWSVVNCLTSEANQETVLNSGFALPSRQSLQDSEFLTTNAAASAIFRGALEGAHPFYWGLAGSDVNTEMGKALERVYLEDMPIADSLQQAAEIIRQKIADIQ